MEDVTFILHWCECCENTEIFVKGEKYQYFTFLGYNDELEYMVNYNHDNFYHFFEYEFNNLFMYANDHKELIKNSSYNYIKTNKLR